MQTRRQSQQKILEVNIDFDDAITEWRKNKKSIGNGQYKYGCYVISDKQCDKVCNKICYKDNDKCWIHRNK